MERHTEYRENGLLVLPVAAGAVCYAGNIAVAAGGYAAPGSEATGLIALGRFEGTVNNSTGAAGDRSVVIRTGVSFLWQNSGTDPVAQADVGQICYIEDATTISKTDNTGARSVAGRVLGIEPGGVWVKTSL